MTSFLPALKKHEKEASAGKTVRKTIAWGIEIKPRVAKSAKDLSSFLVEHWRPGDLITAPCGMSGIEYNEKQCLQAHVYLSSVANVLRKTHAAKLKSVADVLRKIVTNKAPTP